MKLGERLQRSPWLKRRQVLGIEAGARSCPIGSVPSPVSLNCLLVGTERTLNRKIENFIRTKYESKRWVMDGPMPDPSTLDDADDDEVVGTGRCPQA